MVNGIADFFSIFQRIFLKAQEAFCDAQPDVPLQISDITRSSLSIEQIEYEVKRGQANNALDRKYGSPLPSPDGS
jgi:hypothetical protein